MASNERAFLTGARDLVKGIQRHETQNTAASMAYTALFALVPLLIFIAALSGFVSRWVGTDDTVGNVIDFLFRHLPESSAVALQDPIEDILTRQTGSLLSFGAILAIWGAHSVVSAAMRAVNKAYEVEDRRGRLRTNALSLGLTIGIGLTAVICSVSVLLGSRWGDKTADRIGLGEQFAEAWTYVRWPLIGMLLIAALIVFFRLTPAVPTSVRAVIPGAVFCIGGWAIAIFGISFYFSIAGSYAAAYGILGGLLAFVFWLYVMSLVFALAGELNALLHRRAMETVVPPTALPTAANGSRPTPFTAVGG